MKTNVTTGSIDWSKENGLVPAIVQDAKSLRVLMLGYMNEEALKNTLETNLVTFFSRSKQRLWQKGETSGHTLKLVDIKVDCDKDTLLILADPEGPTCHTNELTCFGDQKDRADLAFLADLSNTIRQRRCAAPEGSYTAKLFAAGIPRMAQKVGEEGVEVALAAATQSRTLCEESADLLYHLLVLLEASNASLFEVLKVLRSRACEKGTEK
ncbi:MAG: bifunctional phosphoribosyl-AMP cyclohydrolase/phosphoribosyl-ATP diphosphatase HisIE [Alphaproteobacteria bacterium]|nr:bifunctional phosphoribosyl-AMP cyclohydrolase/phosphoribosyl-ATP diphosphatase HisIE [Alphaproteobacteria bacterium]